jgi:hypothetical protein
MTGKHQIHRLLHLRLLVRQSFGKAEVAMEAIMITGHVASYFMAKTDPFIQEIIVI